MIDHISIGVSNLKKSRLFYDHSLEPLGVARVLDIAEEGSDYGQTMAPFGVEFSITQVAEIQRMEAFHLCFRAFSRSAVNTFFNKAILHGGKSDGAPGLRAYHKDYYAAFVLDPDGHRIEAVCHLPELPEQFEPKGDFLIP